jgi:hypothetical protein
LAKFAAIRRASSRESSLAADRRPRLFFVIDVGKGLAVRVTHNEASGGFFDRPRRREAAVTHRETETTATIFDGNTARIVTKKNPKLGTRSGLFAVCCLT